MRIVLSEFDPGAAVGAREGNRDNAAETLPDTRAIDFYRVQDDAVSAEIQRKIIQAKESNETTAELNKLGQELLNVQKVPRPTRP